MKKLTKTKRMYLVMVTLATVLSLVGIWFGLIRYQQSVLADLATKRAATEKKLNEVTKAIKNPDQIKADLEKVSGELATIENDMASGDLYSWIVSQIRRFKAPYKVDIPQYSQPSVSDVNLLPKFPYKQATVTIAGTAYYEDLGRFIADFENEFQHSRILNLEIDPQSSGEEEKISFRMDIVTLIKPSS